VSDAQKVAETETLSQLLLCAGQGKLIWLAGAVNERRPEGSHFFFFFLEIWLILIKGIVAVCRVWVNFEAVSSYILYNPTLLVPACLFRTDAEEGMVLPHFSVSGVLMTGFFEKTCQKK